MSLLPAQRAVLWSIFERVHSALRARSLVTLSDVFSRVASKLRESAHPPFEFAVVDEAQDVSVPQLRFLAALGAGRPNALFFAGDLVNGSFGSPSPGRRWASMFAGGRLRCESTTGHRIRSELGQTSCWVPSCPTWMAIRKTAR